MALFQRKRGDGSSHLSHFLSYTSLRELVDTVCDQPNERAQKMCHPPDLAPRLCIRDLQEIATEDHREQQRTQQHPSPPARALPRLVFGPDVILPNQATGEDQRRRGEDVSSLRVVFQEMALGAEITFYDNEVLEDKERDTCGANECAT